MQSLSLHYLSQEDTIAAGVLDARACVDTMEALFRLIDRGDFRMAGDEALPPHGLGFGWPTRPPDGSPMPTSGPDRRFAALMGYVGGTFHMTGVKWYGSNVDNKTARQWPRSIHLIVLNDPDHGNPLAIMDGTLISAMRTGAVSGLGSRYLARQDATAVGVVGAGVIARAGLLCHAAVLPELRQIRVVGRDPDRARAFAHDMSPQVGIEIRVVPTIEETITGADVIELAACASDDGYPWIGQEWIKPGAYVGMSGELRCPDDMFTSGHVRLVVDHLPGQKQFSTYVGDDPGSLGTFWKTMALKQIADDDITELGSIASGTSRGRHDDDERIVLSSCGISLEDVAWATVVYRNAVERGIGRELPLWDAPHWH